MTITDVPLKDQVASLPWFYEMDLGSGVLTPGVSKQRTLAERADIYFAPGVKGRSVLDVGAWDGFYSFEAERREAARVLAVDKFCWGHGGWGKRESFQIAREALRSRVEDKLLDIPETTVENVGQFDIVLFNGIVYHILNPVGAIIEMSRIANQLLIIETHIDLRYLQRPAMVFYPGEVAEPGHPQNGWGMNSLLMHSLLKRIGFETIIELPTPDLPEQRSIFMAFKPNHGFSDYVRRFAAFAKPRPMLAAKMGWREIAMTIRDKLLPV